MNNRQPSFRQPCKELRSIAVAVFSVLLLAVTGCSKSNRITTNAAGHPISAVIVGNHSIESQPDRGTISSPFGRVTIERARAKFDDAPWKPMPEGVPMKVSISRGILFLAAGSVTIKRTIR